MTDSVKQVNRIPFENIESEESISTWSLPSIDDGSGVILSAKKEKEKRKKDSDVEAIEDCENPEESEFPTAESLQKITEEARQEGFSQGYTEGFEKGRQKGEKEAHNRVYKETKSLIEQEVRSLRKFTSHLFEPFQSQKNALEDILVSMAVHFAQHIIDQEIKNSPQSILAIIKKALAALPVGANNINVFANQTDVDLVDKYLPAKDRDWGLKIDNNIPSGGCRVETNESLVDYTTAARLTEFIQQVQETGNIDDKELQAIEDYSCSIESNNLPGETSENLEVNTTYEPENNDSLESESISENQTSDINTDQKPLTNTHEHGALQGPTL